MRTALGMMGDVELTVIKNRHTGIWRYPEVIYKIIRCRVNRHPDAWILTFRGYEMLPIVLILCFPKPLVFDELINFMEWTVDEHHKFKAGGIIDRTISTIYTKLLRRCRYILADTAAHASYSSQKSSVDIDKYAVLPVGAIEEPPKISQACQKFEVLYYGSMLPLHGLDYVLRAADLLKDHPDIEFLFIGGKGKSLEMIQSAVVKGAQIRSIKWLDFNKLLAAIDSANLGLGGPFGGTVQARMVITGKTYQFLAYSVPVIIGQSDCTGDFHNKKDSIIVPQADESALAGAVKWAYDHPKELKEIAKNGRQLYQDKFSIKIIRQQLNRIVDRLG